MGDEVKQNIKVGGRARIGQIAGRDIHNGGHAPVDDELQQVHERLIALLEDVRAHRYGPVATSEVAPVLEEALDATDRGELEAADSRLAIASDRARYITPLVAAITPIVELVRSILG